jgi:hypothetical protein
MWKEVPYKTWKFQFFVDYVEPDLTWVVSDMPFYANPQVRQIHLVGAQVQIIVGRPSWWLGL